MEEAGQGLLCTFRADAGSGREEEMDVKDVSTEPNGPVIQRDDGDIMEEKQTSMEECCVFARPCTQTQFVTQSLFFKHST